MRRLRRTGCLARVAITVVALTAGSAVVVIAILWPRVSQRTWHRVPLGEVSSVTGLRFPAGTSLVRGEAMRWQQVDVCAQLTMAEADAHAFVHALPSWVHAEESRPPGWWHGFPWRLPDASTGGAFYGGTGRMRGWYCSVGLCVWSAAGTWHLALSWSGRWAGPERQ